MFSKSLDIVEDGNGTSQPDKKGCATGNSSCKEEKSYLCSEVDAERKMLSFYSLIFKEPHPKDENGFLN